MNLFGSGLSTNTDTDAAIRECVDAAAAGLAGQVPSLAMLFANHHHDDPQFVARVRAETGASGLIGCDGESIVGTGREVESGPAMSLWLAHLPEARVVPFRIEIERSEDTATFHGMPPLPAVSREEFESRRLSMVILGDPFTFPADQWLQRMNEQFAGLPIFGGMASGGRAPGQTRLFYRDRIVGGCAVGILIEGAPVRTIVSQGCRPIGRPGVITRAHANVIDEMAGKPPLTILQELYAEGNEEVKGLIQQAAQGGGLHIGQVVDERISKPQRGDFLVRNVMGADNEDGSMMISGPARVGKTVCFHVRDATSAGEDLHEMLDFSDREQAGGAILFSCNGRGTRMFPAPDHDATCIQQHLGAIPVAGFFAAGEIGPVGGSNFLHGFTASVAVFLK